MKHLLTTLLPAALLGLMFWGIDVMPRSVEMLESALSPELPLEYDLTGWYGQATQESAEERRVLAHDTRFSKGIYIKLRDDANTPRNPTITVSLIFSGNDMNHSIHRPERCLPSQGHLSLNSRAETLQLADGRELVFTRLSSLVPDPANPREYIHFIHYYVFVGHSTILSSHILRTLRDISDRTLTGQVQRWAYFQAGSQWGGSTGHTEEQADTQLRQLIKQLFPQLIDWPSLGLSGRFDEKNDSPRPYPVSHKN